MKNKTKKIRKFINTKNEIYEKCKEHFLEPYDNIELPIINNNLLKKTMKKTEKSIIKMINEPFTSKKYSPNNDFYDYINYNNIKKLQNKYETITEEKKYYVQVDDFRIIQDKVNSELVEIIEEVIKDPKTKEDKCIKKVFHSLTIDNYKECMVHLDNLFKMLNSFVDNDDLWGLLGYINKNEIIRWLCPINWSVNVDLKTNNKYTNYIGLPSFPLYDVNIYFFFDTEATLTEQQKKEKEYKYKKKIVYEYLKFLEELNDAAFGSRLKLIDPLDVFNVQKDIILAMGCDKINNDPDNFYNVVKKEDAYKYDFEWELFAKAIGYEKIPSSFVADSLNYLSCVCKLLKDNWKTQKWKSFWIYIFINEMVVFHPHLRVVPFRFSRKILLGQPKMTPIKIFALTGMSFMFNHFLSRKYIEKYYKPDYINYVKQLFQDLIMIFKRIIKNNKWLSPIGKKNALLKLDYITLNVGVPGHFIRDPLLNYKENDAWYNLILFSEWKTKKLIDSVTNNVKPSDYNFDSRSVDWRMNKLTGTQCYIVNAFYTPSLNEVYIPLAYIQKPFINLNDVGIEYVMAYIGSTLTHEMSHSLDDSGSKFNYKGIMEDIFTKKDRIIYSKIEKDIIKQYNISAKKDGYNFDASISIGEDMADISGLAITIEYLRDYYLKNNVEIPVIIPSLEKFFAYYTISNKSYIYKEAIYNQLIFNPHPMNKYRVNVPLSRSELFREIYKVKKNDGMWWPNLSKIWS
jgi:endothelin-converting enzyme/putative endopeptidase